MCGDVEQYPGHGYCRRNIPELTLLINKKGMKMFHQNARGLFGHVSELLQNFPGIDILSVSETHIEAGLEQEEAIYDITWLNRKLLPRLLWKRVRLQKTKHVQEAARTMCV